MRHAIESGEKILHELCLQNTEFVVNEVCLQTSSIQLCYFAFRYVVVCQTGHDIHDHRRTLSLRWGLLSPLLSRPSHCFLCFPLPLPPFPFLPPLSILPTSLSSPFWIHLGLGESCKLPQRVREIIMLLEHELNISRHDYEQTVTKDWWTLSTWPSSELILLLM